MVQKLKKNEKAREENFYNWRKTGLAAFLSHIAKEHPKELDKFFQEWQHSLN